MLIKNAYIENDKNLSDILIKDGVIKKIARSVPQGGEEVLDLGGKLMIPPYVDSHLHLDTTHSVDYALSKGTLWSGIACWNETKKNLTVSDVRERALRAVRAAVSRGVQHIRTHIDVCAPNTTALEAMLDLKRELRDICNIQIIAFPQEGILSFKDCKARIESALRAGADGIGGIPHYEYTREYSVGSMNYVIDLAVSTGALVDVHCDETDDDSSRGLETLAARALEAGIGERVAASHTTAMHSYSDAYMNRLMRVLIRSGINFVANPLINIHLQGRFDGYPKRRGFTRVKELTEAGLNVSFGQDDVKDPWYPMGNGNMTDVIHMGLHIGHMTTYGEILNSYKFATHNGAKTLCLKGYGIAEGNAASFIVMDAENFFDVVCDKREALYSFNKGKIIARTEAAKRTVYF
ncbi:MAG: cytosine deaminase [Clostridiales bacterium]|jgi:cytosine deaminase|nr:cytosine deaminase [Clostridiales bacterium]